MLKNSVSILILFLLLPGVVFSNPLLANDTYPLVSNSEVDVPLCYIEIADGRKLNLVTLCGIQPKEAASDCIQDTDSAKILVKKANYDGNSLVGQVSNQNCKTIKRIKVNYLVLDDQGNQIDNGFLYAQPSTVPPGQTARFSGTVVSGSQAQVTHIDWSD